MKLKAFDISPLMPEAGVTKGGMSEEAQSKWKYAHIRMPFDDSDDQIHNDEIHGASNATA
jgi:hypothetical protein